VRKKMAYAARKSDSRVHVSAPSIDSITDPSFVLLSHPESQPTTKGKPGTVSSFYLGKDARPRPGAPYSASREIEGYFIDVHSKGIEITPFDGSRLSAEQKIKVIDEFTRQLRTTSQGHAIMTSLTDEQLMALNIETILHVTYQS
jgi:hypothetical protein